MNSLANTSTAEILDFPPGASPVSSFALEARPRPVFQLGENVSNHAAISFTVSAPLAKTYDRWLQYQGFPHFMRGSAGQDPEEHGRITWRIQLDDNMKSAWEAEVSEEIPRERIAWKNISGRPSRNSGSVSFRAVGEDRTQVTISIEFEFTRSSIHLPAPLAALASRLERSLMSFAEFALTPVD